MQTIALLFISVSVRPMEQSKVRRVEPLVLTRSTRAVKPQAASDPAVDVTGGGVAGIVGEGESGTMPLKIKLTRKRPVEAIVEAVLPTEEAAEERGGDNDTEMTCSEVDVEEGGKEVAQTGGKESSSNKGKVVHCMNLLYIICIPVEIMRYSIWPRFPLSPSPLSLPPLQSTKKRVAL
jgi:hypothetical protein